MATTQLHMDISARFLEQAEEDFRRGDLLYAAEQAWGAVAHCVNGIAIDKGWPLGTHKLQRKTVDRLIRRDMETYDRRRLLFLSVENLYTGFYRESTSPEWVRQGIDDARELVAALKALATLSSDERKD